MTLDNCTCSYKQLEAAEHECSALCGCPCNDHPLPVEWKQTDAYRRALAIADKARKEYIAKLERERCETAEQDEVAA